ncbi:hypothetical protein T4D_15457 [Trichinella pseudospiralis]|uniref:Uncharacterized protein n=1 Tax=Trichinella pseudospiralis TaxID=6337 RepID=A0A0V1FUT5_TRIPS|nr:hypothetical protein T4D_15457 [Trichinella pseudospiralis]
MEALEKLFVHLFQDVQNNKCSTYKQLSNNSATSTARICAHRIHVGCSIAQTIWFKMGKLLPLAVGHGQNRGCKS